MPWPLLDAQVLCMVPAAAITANGVCWGQHALRKHLGEKPVAPWKVALDCGVVAVNGALCSQLLVSMLHHTSTNT